MSGNSSRCTVKIHIRDVIADHGDCIEVRLSDNGHEATGLVDNMHQVDGKVAQLRRALSVLQAKMG